MTKSTQCKVCNHEAINVINEKLVSGVSPQVLADEYGLHYHSLWRHREKHLPQTLVKAKQLEESNVADDLLDRVECIYAKAWELMSKADSDGKYQPAVGALKECRSCLELIGRLLGEIKSGTTVNVLYNPEFVQVRQVITEALLPYPDARQAVVRALEGDVIDAEYSDID